MNKKDLFFRFLLGGTAVMLSYIVSYLVPWKILGGIFAAFPVVMVVAVMMMGITSGSKKAAQIAQGSVYGMIGCTICVVSVLFFLSLSHVWWMSILLGLLLWYGSAILILKVREKIRNRRTAPAGTS
ncbi:DUF3147 family protein [Aneurinibacillus terranovensis]|uniref:DUF3147 family protein n=1 Tax=Aneurinibacillus terranovensis TaxID=278991 RepID=UPI00042000C2|nr:DUF3147 family protein [Aneurinibacillus terranovensis]